MPLINGENIKNVIVPSGVAQFSEEQCFKRKEVLKDSL